MGTVVIRELRTREQVKQTDDIGIIFRTIQISGVPDDELKSIIIRIITENEDLTVNINTTILVSEYLSRINDGSIIIHGMEFNDENYTNDNTYEVFVEVDSSVPQLDLPNLEVVVIYDLVYPGSRGI